MPLQRLIYYSTPTTVRPDDIAQIVTTSRANNQKVAVTGMLMFTSDVFLQIMEGRRDHVSDTFMRISNDPRHKNVRLVSLAEVDSRLLTDWGIEYIAHTRDSLAEFKRYYAGNAFDPALMRPAAIEALATDMIAAKAASRGAVGPNGADRAA